MYISTKDWLNYIKRLSAIDNQAAERMQDWIRKNGFTDRKALIDYAYGIATTYGEASGALSAAMYDAIAEMQGKWYSPAVPAPTPEYGEVAKTVNGILKQSENPDMVAGGVSRLVKRTGADTTLLNAERDGAQFAWVPNGDTCAFCLTLASRGWQYMSKKALKNGHAEHIHANCDCTYAIRFNNEDGVAGYDPDKYKRMYNSAEGSTPREKINSMRREMAAEKQEAAKKQIAKSAEMERLRTSYLNTVQTKALDAKGYVDKFDGITGKKDVDEAIYKSAIEILEHRQGTPFEDLHLINAETGEVIHKLTTCDKKNMVVYDDETKEAIKEAHEKGIKILAIHNHPGGLPPTLDDGASAFINDYMSGVAVGHNFEVYVYSAADAYYDIEDCDYIHEEITNTIKYSIDFEEDVWYDVLRIFGMEIIRR